MKRVLVGLMAMSFVFLSACEDEFPGKVKLDVNRLNGPYQLKVVSGAVAPVNGLLAVGNLGSTDFASKGSLQFFDLATRERVESLSLEIPKFVLDFHFYGDKLYLLDRTTNDEKQSNRLLIYQLTDDKYQPLLQSKKQKSIQLFGNPISLTPWDRDGVDYLAILTEGRGSIQFLNLETEEIFDFEDLKAIDDEIGEDRTLSIYSDGEQLIGPRFEMLARSNSKPIEAISGAEQEARGTGKIISFPDGSDTAFALISYLDEAVFGFRFSIFDNNSNLLWNFRDSTRGKGSTKGTDEEGFRGADIDNANRIYLSCRSNNKIFRIEASSLLQERESSRANTRAFGLEALNFALPGDLNFNQGPGVNTSEERFARLGDLVVDPDANRLYVLGLEIRGESESRGRLYFVQNPGGSATMDADDIVGFPHKEEPQSLLLEGDTLVVAATGGNKLYFYDVSGGAPVVQGVVSNP